MTPEIFKASCAKWCTGVSIVTSTDRDGRDFGLTLNSVTSVSIDPPLLLICLDNNSATLEAVKSKNCFCINILSSDQEELAARFALSSDDKFVGLQPKRGELDVPVLAGCVISLECKLEAIHPGGDHKIIVGQLKNVVAGKSSAKPLVFINGKYQ